MAAYERKRKPPHKKGYAGILLEPMPPKMASGVGWETSGAEASLERMKALLRHYGIKYQFEDDVPDKLALFAFMDLVKRLAEDHVTGFQYREEKRGRKKKEVYPCELIREVDALRGKGVSITNACIQLARKAKWREHKSATLARQYKRYQQIRSNGNTSALLKLLYSDCFSDLNSTDAPLVPPDCRVEMGRYNNPFRKDAYADGDMRQKQKMGQK